MFRQYLIDEIDWIKTIIMERTVEQKAEEHNKYYYK